MNSENPLKNVKDFTEELNRCAECVETSPHDFHKEIKAFWQNGDKYIEFEVKQIHVVTAIGCGCEMGIELELKEIPF